MSNMYEFARKEDISILSIGLAFIVQFLLSLKLDGVSDVCKIR